MSEVSETKSSREGSITPSGGQTKAYSAPITIVKLDGTNFQPCSQSAKVTIVDRGK